MKIAVTGSHGLIGSRLVEVLTGAGHRVIRINREAAAPSGHVPSAISSAGRVQLNTTNPAESTRSTPDDVLWDPDAGTIDADALGGIDSVIHLAGARIGLRWTSGKRAMIRNSRVRGTSLIARTVAELDPKPKSLICASAYGYYGDRGDEVLTEDSLPGHGFLADACEQWEAAAQLARDADLRVIHARFGLVLSPSGGALGPMTRLFRVGLGGRVGSGRQWWPWIAIEDAVSALRFAVEENALYGPANFVSPNMVTNAEFARTLSHVLSRPAVLPAPSWAVATLFASAGREMLLSSQRIIPAKLQSAGFQWQLPGLEPALRRQLCAQTEVRRR